MGLRKAEYDFTSIPNFTTFARGIGGGGALGTFSMRNARTGRTYNYNIALGGVGGGMGGSLGFGAIPIERESVLYFGPHNLSDSLAPEAMVGQCMAFLMAGGLVFGGTAAYLYFGLPTGPNSIPQDANRVNMALCFPLARAIGVVLSTYLSAQAGGGAHAMVGHVWRR